MIQFEFWMSSGYGLIRRRRAPGALFHPELWRDGRWRRGGPYVMDAITGMGEDGYSCGEWADEIDASAAEEYAAANGIDLYADNPEDSHGEYL